VRVIERGVERQRLVNGVLQAVGPVILEGRALSTGFVGPLGVDDWHKLDMPGLRGIRKTAPYFHNNNAGTLEDVVDHDIAFFTRAKAVALPGVAPPFASTDGPPA
jgi:cytochrome c peroxidase